MRKPFIEILTELAEKDPKVILIVGDVGFSFIEQFKERFPNQFINVGALEQTMMSFAAGMSKFGWKPVVYTMRNFIAFFCSLSKACRSLPKASNTIETASGGPSEAHL